MIHYYGKDNQTSGLLLPINKLLQSKFRCLVPCCIHFFSVTVVEYPDQSILREEGFIWLPVPREHIVEITWQLEHETPRQTGSRRTGSRARL